VEAARFGFGENWRKFNAALTNGQRTAARDSLTDWLGDIRGKSFLDIGAGSGVFAAAAAELGADVRAFDYDPAHAGIEHGDVLDQDYIKSLGRFDVVYSWGVLHHTGAMWDAIGNACEAVVPGGLLLISIYNDQGEASRRWWRKKRLYNLLPSWLRVPYAAAVMTPWEARRALRMTRRGESYLAEWRRPQERGMSKWRDIIDWVGGFPYEFATRPAVISFCEKRGFELARIRENDGWGCNEYLFRADLNAVDRHIVTVGRQP
jgi:SAM-dependent methyltransferase